MVNPLIGQTLGHYKVIDQIGVGGMGIVYRAQDTKLGRQVALKVLPTGSASSHEAVERFRREARTASALNHPNICTIFGFDEQDGQCYLTMELLDGEPLDSRLSGRALDLQPLLDIGIQVTDALDAAHSEGILHRDIKPANIFITRRGQVKVLDFGLAKLASNARLSTHGGLETVAPDHFSSVVGTTVGTIAYMSPEQARGEELDSRTDLFSFGVVLYEMATGRQSFPGSTTAVVFDGILNRDPAAPSTFNAMLPGELDRIVSKALEKERTLRYQTAMDLRSDLQRLRRDSGSRRVSVAGMIDRSHVEPAPSGTSSPVSADAAVPAPVPASRVDPVAASAFSAAPAGVPAGSAVTPPSKIPWMVAAGAVVVALAAVIVGVYLSGRPATSEADTPADVQAVAANGEGDAEPPPGDADASPPPPVTAAVVPDTPPPAAKPAAPPAESRPAAKGASTPAPASAPAANEEAAERLEVARAKIASNLIDQGVADLRAIVIAYPGTSIAADAGFLAAETLEKAGRTDDAMAAYLEFGNRFGEDSRAPDSKLRRATILARARQAPRQLEANQLFTEVARDFPGSPQARQALAAKRQYEASRRQLRALDPVLNIQVPAVMVTWRMIADQFPGDPETMLALNSLAAAYADMNHYETAAQVWEHMARQFPPNPMEVWWTLGELYERRLKDPAKARDAYARVPAESPRYRDAQQRLRR